MPEGVEVFILSNKINKLIKNLNIINIKIKSGKYKTHTPPINFKLIKKSLPLKIKSVKSKGKFIYITLNNNWFIFITLGMKGVLRFDNKNIKHDNIEFTLNDKNTYNLFFNDYRNFGNVYFLNNKMFLVNKLNCLGPDVIDKKFNYNLFKKCLHKIKNKDIELLYLLINQEIISGIGNYLRADILYCAKLNPFRSLRGLSDDNLKILFKSIKYVVNRSYKLQIRGKSIKDNTLIYNKKITNKGEKIDNMKDKFKRTIWFVPSVQN